MTSPNNRQILTVSELNGIIKEILEGTFTPFWLAGELGNLTIHRSGHVYLTIKDARSQISGVYFNGAGSARKLGIREGDEVEVYGRISVYEPRGQYQVVIQEMRPKGIGAL